MYQARPGPPSRVPQPSDSRYPTGLIPTIRCYPAPALRRDRQASLPTSELALTSWESSENPNILSPVPVPLRSAICDYERLGQLIGVTVRRERRWTSAGVTPAR